MGSVMAQVPQRERSLVRARAHRLRAAIGVLDVTRRLRRRASVQVAAIAPGLPFDRLSLLTRYTLWTYRLDNRVETLGEDLVALARLRDEITAVTTGDLSDPEDPLLADLGHNLRELSECDPTGDIVAWCGDAVRDAIAAEVDQRRLERAVAAGAPLPTAERYLEVAIRNMNYRSFAYALLAVSGDRLIDPELRCIDAALWHASRAVRLGNDLRGVAQDRAQGTLNVLGLTTAAGRMVTTGYVWKKIDHHLRSHDTMLQVLIRLGAIREPPAEALTRSLAQAIRLYRRTDLR